MKTRNRQRSIGRLLLNLGVMITYDIHVLTFNFFKFLLSCSYRLLFTCMYNICLLSSYLTIFAYIINTYYILALHKGSLTLNVIFPPFWLARNPWRHLNIYINNVRVVEFLCASDKFSYSNELTRRILFHLLSLFESEPSKFEHHCNE